MIKISKFVNKYYLELCQRWFKYVPEFWDVETLLDKKARELTEEEITRLKLLKEGNTLSNAIQKFINKVNESGEMTNLSDLCELNITSEETNELNTILDYFDFDNIAASKLSVEELDTIESIITKYNGFNKEEIVKDIENIKSNYVKEYTHYCFKNKLLYTKVKKPIKANYTVIN